MAYFVESVFFATSRMKLTKPKLKSGLHFRKWLAQDACAPIKVVRLSYLALL